MLDLIVWALCAYRITRLITEDTLFDPLRHITIHKLKEGNYFRDLFECPYCVSVWVAFGVVILGMLENPYINLFIVALAVAGAVSLAWRAIEDAQD